MTADADLLSIGVAVRLWQLGIEMRPFFNRGSLWGYPLFAAVGGSFGYWMEGVTQQQLRVLSQRKESLLEKRRRRAEREARQGVAGQVDGAVHEAPQPTDGPRVISGTAWGH